MTEPSFNLLDEPWILVLTKQGRTEELSILDVFRRAPELDRVVGELPTQGFAILRVLLAILARSVDGPPDAAAWRELAAAEPPMDRIEEYCGRYRDRFWLFHPEAPFFQVAGLHTAKNEYSGLEKLIADVPAGHPFFTTRINAGVERITAAEAARWVVHSQAFDCSGIKSGAVGDDRVKGGKGYPIGTGWAGTLGGLYVEGVDLWHTLLLNTIPTAERELFFDRDRPAWEAEPSGPGEAVDAAKRPYGPLDLFTWQFRRIRLRGGSDGVTGVVLANGDKLAPPYAWQCEPMTAWRRSVPQQKKLGMQLVYMPLAHLPSRALWRGLQAMLPAAAPRSRAADGQERVAPEVFEWAARSAGRRAVGGRSRVALHAVGMEYGPQSATFINLVDDAVVVSPEILKESGSRVPGLAISAVEATEAAVNALRNLAANLTQAAGGSDDNMVAGARDRASERAYAALDGPFREWLAALGPDVDDDAAVDQARAHWHETARAIVGRIGRRLVAEAGPAAWVGREVRNRHVCSPLADGWFRRALAEVLPVPREESSTKEKSA